MDRDKIDNDDNVSNLNMTSILFIENYEYIFSYYILKWIIRLYVYIFVFVCGCRKWQNWVANICAPVYI